MMLAKRDDCTFPRSGLSGASLLIVNRCERTRCKFNARFRRYFIIPSGFTDIDAMIDAGRIT